MLIAPSPNALQNLIMCSETFACTNEITYNAKKSKVMCVQPKGKDKLYIPDFSVNGKTVELIKQHQYLGFVLSEDLKDDLDIKRQIRGLFARGNMVIKCFKYCSAPVKIL